MGKLKRGRRTTRAESIKAAHIALVLPATDPDPSHPGFFGTRALRLSEDIPNPARTFSLLYGDWGTWGATAAEELPSGGNWTLDLECDDDVTYAMLFQVQDMKCCKYIFCKVRLPSVEYDVVQNCPGFLYKGVSYRT